MDSDFPYRKREGEVISLYSNPHSINLDTNPAISSIDTDRSTPAPRLAGSAPVIKIQRIAPGGLTGSYTSPLPQRRSWLRP